MGRRLLASLAATAAVATSLLIGSAGSATAQDATAQSVSAADARGSGGVTPNGKLKNTPIYVDETQFKIVATLRGVGQQIYTCSGGTATLREPAAVLSTLRGATVGIHGKGPFWTHFDGSRVDGSAPVSTPSPDATKNIPWLKITATPTGTGVLGDVALIQRIDTRGGLAPSPCNSPTASVGYSANYVFWAKK